MRRTREKSISPPGEAPGCTLLEAVLETALEHSGDSIIFALDRGCRYIDFNSMHRQEMCRVWHVGIRLGDSILDQLTIPGLREEAQQTSERGQARCSRCSS